MDEISDIVSRAFDEGDALDAAPIETPATDTAGPADNAEATGEGSPAQEGADSPFRWENVPPELEPLAKGFQADYTRKSQELAEQRKAFDAQAEQYQRWQALQQIAQTDPALAEQVIRASLGLTDAGVQAAPGETDPFAQLEPVTDYERALAEQNRAMEARLARQEAFIQQQQRSQNEARIEAEFGALEKMAGRPIPPEERDRIATACIQQAVKHGDGTYTAPSVTQMFREMNWESEIARAMQRGRDEAAGVTQQKAAAGAPPSGIVNRTPTTQELPRETEALVGHLWDRISARG